MWCCCRCQSLLPTGRLWFVRIDRGVLGVYPYASVGDGPPVVVLAGLFPSTGVDGDITVKGVLSPFRPWNSLAG